MTSDKLTILAIDDEPDNLQIIEDFLELDDSQDYHYLSADNAETGWEILQEKGEAITVILLDRMMPGTDGMALLTRIRADGRFNRIPVILQTAAASKEQIIEGMQAGAFYYLTKPYEQEMLIAIINSAVADRQRQDELLVKLRKQQRIMQQFMHVTVRFQTLEDAYDLSTVIASCFPEPDRVLMGLSELMINAVEHGNLGITYHEKTELIAQGRWQKDVEMRARSSEHKHKWAVLTLTRTADMLEVVIKDQGKGFDNKRFMEIDPDRATHTHGRGIAMANMLSFDELAYSNGGNTVTARVRLPAASVASAPDNSAAVA